MKARTSLFMLGLAVCLAAAAAFAELVTLAWDPNPPEPAVGYYTIYSRLDGEPYLGILDVEPSGEPQASVDVEIPGGFCRFFVCTATSAVGGYESGYSNEVYKCKPADQEPPPDFGRSDCSEDHPCANDCDGDGDVDGSDLVLVSAGACGQTRHLPEFSPEPLPPTAAARGGGGGGGGCFISVAGGV